MIEKLIRKGQKQKSKPIYLALGEITLGKVGELAKKQNTTKREIVRYLVDLAIEGKIEFK